MMLDAEINGWFCLGFTWKCTPVEALGVGSVCFYFLLVITITAAHLVIQSSEGTLEGNEAVTRRHTVQDEEPWCELFGFMGGLFAGALLWSIVGVRYVHPLPPLWPVQLTGVAEE